MMEMAWRPAFSQADLLEDEQPSLGILTGNLRNVVRAGDGALLVEAVHAVFHLNNARGSLRCGWLSERDQGENGSLKECAPFHVCHPLSTPRLLSSHANILGRMPPILRKAIGWLTRGSKTSGS
jgi:hypothetical protein